MKEIRSAALTARRMQQEQELAQKAAEREKTNNLARENLVHLANGILGLGITDEDVFFRDDLWPTTATPDGFFFSAHPSEYAVAPRHISAWNLVLNLFRCNLCPPTAPLIWVGRRVRCIEDVGKYILEHQDGGDCSGKRWHLRSGRRRDQDEKRKHPRIGLGVVP